MTGAVVSSKWGSVPGLVRERVGRRFSHQAGPMGMGNGHGHGSFLAVSQGVRARGARLAGETMKEQGCRGWIQ